MLMAEALMSSGWTEKRSCGRTWSGVGAPTGPGIKLAVWGLGSTIMEWLVGVAGVAVYPTLSISDMEEWEPIIICELLWMAEGGFCAREISGSTPPAEDASSLKEPARLLCSWGLQRTESGERKFKSAMLLGGIPLMSPADEDSW